MYCFDILMTLRMCRKYLQKAPENAFGAFGNEACRAYCTAIQQPNLPNLTEGKILYQIGSTAPENFFLKCVPGVGEVSLWSSVRSTCALIELQDRMQLPQKRNVKS